MKYFYGLLLLVFFFPFSSRGQSNYQKGFVVTLAGDTLRGLINVREWTQNPQAIAFKKSETDPDHQEFSPLTSRYFEVPGQVAYQSFSGRISMNSTDFTKLLSWVDTSKTTVSAFLRVVHSGRHVRLLAYQDDIKIRFFLQEQNGLPQELGFRVFMDQQQSRVRTFKFYAGQLLLAAEKFGTASAALKKQLATVAYQEADLETVVARINGLDEQQMKAIKNKGGNYRLLLGAGLSRGAFKVTGNHELAENSTYGANYRPKLSLGADLLNNPEVQRSFLRGQLTLTESVADIRMKKDGFLVREGTLTFKQRTLGLSAQGIYNFYNGPKYQFNVGLGASMNLSAYADESFRTRTYTRLDGSIATGSNTKEELNYQTIWVSVPVRTGLIVNRQWDVSLLYFIPTPVTSGDGNMNYTGMHLEVNYLFNRNRGK